MCCRALQQIHSGCEDALPVKPFSYATRTRVQVLAAYGTLFFGIISLYRDDDGDDSVRLEYSLIRMPGGAEANYSRDDGVKYSAAGEIEGPAGASTTG